MSIHLGGPFPLSSSSDDSVGASLTQGGGDELGCMDMYVEARGHP